MATHPPGAGRPEQPALYRFHRVLIGAAVALGVVLGGWGVWDYTRDGDARSLVTGLSSLAAGAVLALYLRRFNQRTRS